MASLEDHASRMLDSRGKTLRDCVWFVYFDKPLLLKRLLAAVHEVSLDAKLSVAPQQLCIAPQYNVNRTMAVEVLLRHAQYSRAELEEKEAERAGKGKPTEEPAPFIWTHAEHVHSEYAINVHEWMRITSSIRASDEAALLVWRRTPDHLTLLLQTDLRHPHQSTFVYDSPQLNTEYTDFREATDLAPFPIAPAVVHVPSFRFRAFVQKGLLHATELSLQYAPEYTEFVAHCSDRTARTRVRWRCATHSLGNEAKPYIDQRMSAYTPLYALPLLVHATKASVLSDTTEIAYAQDQPLRLTSSFAQGYVRFFVHPQNHTPENTLTLANALEQSLQET